MTLPFGIRDTIAKRLCAAIMLAVTGTLVLTWLLSSFASSFALPALDRSGLFEQAASITRVIQAAPPSLRSRLAAAAATSDYQVDWYDDATPVPAMLRIATDTDAARDAWKATMAAVLGDPDRRVVIFRADDGEAYLPALHYDRAGHPDAYFMAIALDDQSWLVFTALQRSWGMYRSIRIAIICAILLLSTLLVSAVTAKQLAAPMKRFVAAARRFGTDPRAPPIEETGPAEFRMAIGAFNAMQAQIARFISDRTEMLAAISHDLRTPLTRMRLRGEFVEDEDQQRRLFQDVDEMQTMVDEALTFFRDNAAEEQSTNFDMAELLRTIIDDFADQGSEVGYEGPDHVVYFGRPFALKRAFTNLIDNARRYACLPSVELSVAADAVVIGVKDRGHGIPPDQLSQVFAPFYRLEPSRNRSTGGYGLGLSAARTIVRAHGGELELRNRDGGGLGAISTLPRSPT
ncbi:MAG: integral rane sensor signal transduction histidine kinase [Rhodospirillales bacterium]|nr:integral rane sensor signal transduction histidine kinase [Rhodospirillales bacterium]